MNKDTEKLESEIGKAVIRACEDGKSAEVKHDPKTGEYKVLGVNKKIAKKISAA